MELNLIKENEMFGDYSGHDDLGVLEDLFEIDEDLFLDEGLDFDDDKPKKWEYVSNESNIRSDRMQVAGGWIYRTIVEKSSGSYTSFSNSVAMVFVPH